MFLPARVTKKRGKPIESGERSVVALHVHTDRSTDIRRHKIDTPASFAPGGDRANVGLDVREDL